MDSVDRAVERHGVDAVGGGVAAASLDVVEDVRPHVFDEAAYRSHGGVDAAGIAEPQQVRESAHHEPGVGVVEGGEPATTLDPYALGGLEDELRAGRDAVGRVDLPAVVHVVIPDGRRIVGLDDLQPEFAAESFGGAKGREGAPDDGDVELRDAGGGPEFGCARNIGRSFAGGVVRGRARAGGTSLPARGSRGYFLWKALTSALPIRSGTVQPSRSYSPMNCSARPFMEATSPRPSAANSSSALTFSWFPA